MKKTLVGLVCVAALAAAPSGSARMAVANCNADRAPRVELACARANLKHANDVLRFLDRHPGFGTVRSRRLVHRDHAWLRGLGLRRLAEARARLAPPIAHWALWSCITNGAYAGAPHEGNGYNGKYTGPLGMTTPWAGHMPTGSDWVHTPVATVYGFAEQEYARHGYSRAWLFGQWPATSPPCV